MTAKSPEKKSIFVPRLNGSKEQPPLEGSVNGKPFLLPRGQVSEIESEVYEVVERSLRAEIEAEDYYNNLQANLIKRAQAEAEVL